MSPNAAPDTKSHTPTSPNTAPATQNASHDWSASHMKRHLECAEQAKSTSNLSKYCACHEIFKFKIAAETPWIASANRKTIRRPSDDHPRIKSSSRTRRFGDLTRPTLNTILYWKIQHFALRLSPKMSPNAAPDTKSHTPTSPNTAPATQNASHDWSASHMRHLQCAEQAQSASNLTKYCACHEIYKVKISAETPWIASANRKTIRRPSDDHPRIKSSSRTRRFGDLTRPISETILYWKIQHFALRLSPKMSPNAAPATKSHTPTSANTAPATQNESLGIYSLLASIHSWHLFPLGIHSLLASILFWHLFSLGIYSLLASIPPWHLFSLGIYSLLASILSWHLFSLGIYSLLASIR